MICGLGGDDLILGNGGRDTIDGGAGNDRVSGGAGDDRLVGGIGNDVLSGDAGNDFISAGGGRDQVAGGAGADRLLGDDGNDSVSGGDGPDSIDAGRGDDLANGDTGGDMVAGGPGDDALQGGLGSDRIIAGTGSDTCARDPSDAISGSCLIDLQAPVVEWINVPAEVTAGTSLTVTFSYKDSSGAGLGVPDIRIGGAPGWITSWCGWPIDATLVSGDARDGVWSVTCPVPAKAVNDSYSLHLNAYDVFGNRSVVEVPDFKVVGGSADSGPPTITDVVIPKTAKPGETITLTWRAADPSGVKDTPFPWVYRPAPQFGVLYGEGILGEPTLTSGTATDGAWSQTIKLPDNAISGTYTVYISVRDELGNKSYQQYGNFFVG